MHSANTTQEVFDMALHYGEGCIYVIRKFRNLTFAYQPKRIARFAQGFAHLYPILLSNQMLHLSYQTPVHCIWMHQTPVTQSLLTG